MIARKLFGMVSSVLLSIVIAILVIVTVSSASAEVEAVNPTESPPPLRETYRVYNDQRVVVSRAPDSMNPTIGPLQVCTKPHPIPVAPINSVQLDNLVPSYQIYAISDTFRYRFEVATDTTFSSVVRDVTLVLGSPPVSGTLLGVISFENLAPNTVHYWHVASVCADEETGEYSPVQTFCSGFGGTLPGTPALLSPDDGANVGSIRVSFHLGEVAGAERYQVRFYHSPGAAVDDWFRATQGSGTVRTTTLDPQETIYWRGMARNSYAWGAASGERSFTTPPVSATTTIDPASGATLAPDPGNISIQFPPNAVAEPTDLNYTLHSYPTQSLANFRFAGRAFTLEAFDQGGQPVNAFAQSFTITIVYDGFDLIAAGIVDPADLNLAYWDGDAWVNILPCTGCSIDTDTRTVTVVIDHLTEFALLAPRKTCIYLPLIVRQ